MIHRIFVLAIRRIRLSHCLFAVVLALSVSLVFNGGCASTGYPGGGPRDEDPPFMVGSTPSENALGFKGDEIRIEFNELVQVKDIFQKLMVSPPVNEQPTVTARGRDLLVKFNEELQPNTTYTLDFADAISDNNEGNVLPDFRFSFSTGDIIDSLQISGFLFDAENLTPVANALVMVHKNHADSAFIKQVPIRVTKSNSEGRFTISNLASGEYRVFALEDANRNFRYDQPGERIAWHSELISPYVGFHERIDSIGGDSTVVVRQQAFLPDSLNLFLFQEDNVPQYLKDSERKTRNRVDLIFSRPLKQPLDIDLVNNPAKDWFVYEHSFRHDSITLWITDSLLIKGDSLLMSFRYPVLDSLRQEVLKSDTLNAYFFDMSGGAPRTRRRDQAQAVEVPALRPEGLKGSLDILEEMSFSFPTPVRELNTSAFRLFQIVDSVPDPISFSVVQDSLRIRRFVILFQREPGGRYSLEMDSAAVTDVYGLSTRLIKQEFSVKTEDSYGIFYVAVENPQDNWLLQILNRQEKVIRQARVPANGRIAFRYLRPGDYFLRIVVDKNRNGQWDSGDFLKGIQPEQLIYFPESINIRANWDRVIPWDPNTFNIYDFVKTNRQKTSTQRR